MNSRLYFVVVLYNGYIEKMVSLDTFLKFCENSDCRLIVMDNSSEEYTEKNERYAENNSHITYVNNHGNIGLSRSYNKAISLIDDEDYWVMICDDDTQFSKEYIKNVIEYVNKENSCDVVTGIVRSNGTPKSPVTANGIFKKRSDTVDKPGTYKCVYPINSGLVIHGKVFSEEIRFTEELFVDMSDYCFMEDLMKNGYDTVEVLDGDINQSFSFAEKTDKAAVIRRFNIFKKDFRNYCRIQNKGILYKRAILGKRQLRIWLMR